MTAPISFWRQWPYSFFVLLVSAVPAFWGRALAWIPGEIMPGVDWGIVVYFGVIHLVILFLLGRRWYANLLTLATLVSLPVVYAGAAITWLGPVLGLIDHSAAATGTHYVKLGLTMLTVVPLALGLMAVIPFNSLENRLLLRPEGISMFQKKILMVLRVFNHTVFFVIPSLLEVMREERSMIQTGAFPTDSAIKSGYGWARFRRLLEVVTYLAVESICAAVQFIPLWAYEIGRLPESPRESKGGTSHQGNGIPE
jgi:hypothetical protein